MYRKTYKEINLTAIECNARKIIEKYNNYKWHMAMIKSNAYGHGYGIIDSLIKGGINYLCVSSLDEAIEARKYNKDIGVLCTEIIDLEYISKAFENNITISVCSYQYLKELLTKNIKLKIHIKVDSGMNRLGVKDKHELLNMYNSIINSECVLEGIYTHFATPGVNDIYYDKQVSNFIDITSLIDLSKIEIVHLSSSFILVNHNKLPFETGFRIGTLLYGYDVSLPKYKVYNPKDLLRMIRDKFYQKKYKLSGVIRGNKIDLMPAFSIKSRVMEIKDVLAGEFIGYGPSFIAKENMRVCILPIGYDDGIGTNTYERFVIINNKKYSVISIAMCMCIVKIDDTVKLNDEVTILGGSLTLGYISRLNSTTIQNTLISIGKTLDIKYMKGI